MRVFGEHDGRPVELITIEDGDMRAEVLTYGATLRSLSVPDRDGAPVDVVLGYDRLEDYVSRSGRLGATIGRFANRISNASFTLGGKEYRLAANRGIHHIHGGNVGFDRRVWDVAEYSNDSVTLRLDSPDGDEGYPGNLRVYVTYTLTDGALRIEYLTRSDADTVCNLTNHTYFNLAGKGDVGDHEVALSMHRYTEADENGIPTGRILDADGFYDLTEPAVLSERLSVKEYDLNYLTDSEGRCASVYCARSGITMETYTDMPAVQFYTGGGLKEGTPGKGGNIYGRNSGLCLETQFCPDSPNRPEFPSCILRKGECYRHWTEYRFSA